MKNKILYIGLIIAAALLSFGSCTDLLDQKPQGEWVEGDGSGGSFQSDVFTLYARIRGFHITSGTTALAIHGFRSEDAEKGSTAADGAAHGVMFDDFEYIATNGLIS